MSEANNEMNMKRMAAEKTAETQAAASQLGQVPAAQVQTGEAKKKKGFIFIIILLLAVIGVLVFFLLKKFGAVPADDTTLEMDERAMEGLLAGRSEQEIKDLLNQTVEEGMLNVTMNSLIKVGDNSEGDVCIENVETNRYAIQVNIEIEDSEGTRYTIYESGVIKPGYSIEYGKFNSVPPEGAIDGVAVVRAIDLKTKKDVGKVSLNVILQHGNVE